MGLYKWLSDGARMPAPSNPILWFLHQIRVELGRFLVPLDIGIALNFILAGVLFWAYDYYGDTKFFKAKLREPLGLTGIEGDAAAYFYWYGCCFVMLMVIPLIVVALNRKDRVADYGFGLGDWKLGFSISGVFIAVMVIVLLFVHKDPSFQDYYPLFKRATKSWELFIYYELAYALYFVAWEFMFRGYMTFGLEKGIGKWAIFVQMLPFATLHFGKPSIEALSSIFGGILLGWLALRTRSFWYGVLIHAVMAVTLDLLVGVPRLMEAASP